MNAAATSILYVDSILPRMTIRLRIKPEKSWSFDSALTDGTLGGMRNQGGWPKPPTAGLLPRQRVEEQESKAVIEFAPPERNLIATEERGNR